MMLKSQVMAIKPSSKDYINSQSRFYVLICLVLLILSIAGCDKGRQTQNNVSSKSNGVYYWNTVLELDSLERDFLKDNNVKRAYVRFFDIVVDKSPLAKDVVVPNATLQFKDTLPVGEIIPTIFITVEAIEAMQSNESEWAERIVNRVFNMCSYNELEAPKEIQLDCDWTQHTDAVFFNLCREVRKELQSRDSIAKLSATIRLHQLSQTPPPVDYGVLMVYNTGSFRNPEEKNSILEVNHVRPYLKHLASYRLPLDFAFPIFSWTLVYQDNLFKGIFNSNVNLPDDMLKPMGDNRYAIVRDTLVNHTYLRIGDVIRKEDVSFKTIGEVKNLLESNYPQPAEGRGSIILFNLDSQNLSNFTENEIMQIYN